MLCQVPMFVAAEVPSCAGSQEKRRNTIGWSSIDRWPAHFTF
jgi:hypothetical protein